MAGPKKEVDILEDVEKKSEDLMHSNEELAARLRHNQATLETIGTELESLRSGEGFDPALKSRLESLKADLEEKRDLISDLIDSVKPLEVDLGRSQGIVDALKQKIEDQGQKIESLSKDIFEHRKNMQQLSEANKLLKEKLVEKESTVQIMKERLKEKTDLLRAVDEKNRNMEQQVDAAQKKAFALENKLGALEKQIYEGDERNQRLMYELMKSKDKLKQFEALAANKDMLLEEKDAEFEKAVENLRLEGEEKRRLIMEAHSKKVALMNAQIVSLRTALDRQQKLAEARKKKEQALMSEFRERMQSIMSTSLDISNVPLAVEEGYSEPAESFGGTEEYGVAPPPEEGPAESRMDEIVPIVERALEQGETAEDIERSLTSSGYSESEVIEALRSLQETDFAEEQVR